MASSRIYSTAIALRTALEERLKKTALAERMDINRLRRQVSFDRLLARLFRAETVPWVLKGGYSLELRFKKARATVDIDLALAPCGGARYPVEAKIDGRTFSGFHLDAGIGDVVMQPFETIVGRDLLGFAGIESSPVRMIGREQQFAEKIHAYRRRRSVVSLVHQ